MYSAAVAMMGVGSVFYICLLDSFGLECCSFVDLPSEYSAAAAAAKSLQSCLTLCDPIRRQPTRLPCPWDSPGKNTGVGCCLLLQCLKVKS